MGKGAAEPKKEEIIGAVAIKPPGWDRTGLEAFRYFLYDPDNGTILSRTPKSWALITIFYTIYYSCLAAFWYVCLLIFFQTLPEETLGPKWKQDGSLIGVNPGIGIRPLNRDERIDSNMFSLKFSDTNYVLSEMNGEGDLNIDYAKRAALFMDIYNKPAGAGYNKFDLASLGPCAQHPYGYTGDKVKPCVFLKFNKIWGWDPTPITEEDFATAEEEGKNWPGSFKTHWAGQNDKNQIWVDCQGRYPADKEVVAAAMSYYPSSQGFPTSYFPYEGKKDEYHSPLVAVQFDIPEQYIGQLIHVECRAYYSGVKHETKSKAGLVQFEVILNK